MSIGVRDSPTSLPLGTRFVVFTITFDIIWILLELSTIYFPLRLLVAVT